MFNLTIINQRNTIKIICGVFYSSEWQWFKQIDNGIIESQELHRMLNF